MKHESSGYTCTGTTTPSTPAQVRPRPLHLHRYDHALYTCTGTTTPSTPAQVRPGPLHLHRYDHALYTCTGTTTPSTPAQVRPRPLHLHRYDQALYTCTESPAGLMWSEQFSPHLQRNKQLQDALLQREEELLRLQDENQQLRGFLSSAFVRNLQREAKKLTPDGRRNPKRHLTYGDDGSFQNRGHQLQTSQVSKRVCRNLTTEFCSSSSSSEPNLDLWVLRTLGLKDRDTIDTSSESSCSSGFGLGGLVHDAAASSSSGYTLDSSFSPSVSTSKPSSGHDAAGRHQANGGNPAEPTETCTTSPGRRFTATGLTCPEVEIRSYSTSAAFRPPPTEEPPFSRSAGGAEVCFVTAPSRVQSLEGNPARPPAHWSPLRGTRTPSRDTIQFSPPFSPISSPSPTPAPPRRRTDLAFRMSLSPSSSVKTHSFPQGQAFVRKDPEGRCNFTWVPTQRP
ncbi:geminin coiled-coil domain-containing protein 1 [Cyclopterus lumpus]|uniref:geminin coiled-coil domain-containing protein 1 n=1 Tax=Cyclopterus lumpus TaxID=8103 RepID=UPI001485CBFE|nr:geminin coiled-coil domain-containing protein 1 [Cyclopterus lumpus]